MLPFLRLWYWTVTSTMLVIQSAKWIFRFFPKIIFCYFHFLTKRVKHTGFLQQGEVFIGFGQIKPKIEKTVKTVKNAENLVKKGKKFEKGEISEKFNTLDQYKSTPKSVKNGFLKTYIIFVLLCDSGFLKVKLLHNW